MTVQNSHVQRGTSFARLGIDVRSQFEEKHYYFEVTIQASLDLVSNLSFSHEYHNVKEFLHDCLQ